MEFELFNQPNTPGAWMKRLGIDYRKAENGIAKTRKSLNGHGLVRIEVKFTPWEGTVKYMEKEIKPFSPMDERVVEDWIFDIDSEKGWEPYNEWFCRENDIDLALMNSLTDPNSLYTKPLNKFTKKDIEQFNKDSNARLAAFDAALAKLGDDFDKTRAARLRAEAEAEKALGAAETALTTPIATGPDFSEPEQESSRD